MTNILWVDGLIVAAAVITAITVIWRKFLQPLLRAIETLTETVEALPTLLEIAQQFQPNEGHTLRDSVDRIEGLAAKANEMATKAAVSAELSKSMVEGLGTSITELDFKVTQLGNT
jgi:hypothetical protein